MFPEGRYIKCRELASLRRSFFRDRRIGYAIKRGAGDAAALRSVHYALDVCSSAAAKYRQFAGAWRRFSVAAAELSRCG